MVMVAAMVDHNIEVVEVITDEHGSRDFVNKGSKKPKDTIVKTWSKTIKTTPAVTKESKDDNTPQNIYTITLSAKEAVEYTKIADATAFSRSDVIEDLKAEGVKVIATSRIKTRVRKFAINRKQLGKYYAGIAGLEAQLEEIEKQIKEVSSVALKNQPSNDRLRRLERKEYEERLKSARKYKRLDRPNRVKTRDGEYLTDEEMYNLEQRVGDTYVDPYLILQQRLAMEAAYVLDDLLAHYVKAAKIARQYPGAMPKGKTLKELQIKYNSAAAKRNSLGF